MPGHLLGPTTAHLRGPISKTNTTGGQETYKREVFWNLAKFRLVYNPTVNVKLQNSQFSLPKGPEDFLRAHQIHINEPQNKPKPIKTLLWAWGKF